MCRSYKVIRARRVGGEHSFERRLRRTHAKFLGCRGNSLNSQRCGGGGLSSRIGVIHVAYYFSDIFSARIWWTPGTRVYRFIRAVDGRARRERAQRPETFAMQLKLIFAENTRMYLLLNRDQAPTDFRNNGLQCAAAWYYFLRQLCTSFREYGPGEFRCAQNTAAAHAVVKGFLRNGYWSYILP